MGSHSRETALDRAGHGNQAPEALPRLRPLPHRIPDYLQKFPPEIRNRIYEFALPSKPNTPNSPTLIHGLQATSTSEPPLLRVASYIRQEAGSIYYADRPFSIEIDGNVSRLRWTIRQLEGIARRHGHRAFRKGLWLQWKGTGAIGNLQRFFPLVNSVWRTGMVLLPIRVMEHRRHDRRTAASNQASVGQSKWLLYVGQQLLIEHQNRENTTLLMLVALGMRGYESSWSYNRLRREMRAFRAAHVAAGSRVRERRTDHYYLRRWKHREALKIVQNWRADPLAAIGGGSAFLNETYRL